MAIVINGNGIDMGVNPVSNASQIDSTVINESGSNVRTESDSYSKTEVDGKIVGFKNYIINGNFDIWQRGESFSSISPAFFTADRWLLDWAGVASGLSASKQTVLVGNNSLYITRTSGAYMQVHQMVENQGNLSNKTFTFSALVRSTYNGSVNFKIADGRTGTNFVYNQTPVTLETNITKKVVFTVQLGQVSADALFVGIVTTCSDLYVDIVQMEEGSVATPFENRPYGLELSLCQRYYEKILTSIRAYADGGGFYWTIPLKVNKRNTPTIIQGTSFSGFNVSSSTGVTGISQENITYRLMPVTAGFCTMDNLSLEIISEL